jgi:ribosomal-protein-alanine N-acetyltransferase
MPDIHLRDIRPSDLEALYALDQLCFEPGIAYSRSELKQILRLSSGQAVIAESQGQIEGFAAGYVSERGFGHIVTLDVSPDRRRKGIGRALLQELLERLTGAGAVEARLEVEAVNAGAIAFYEGLGFLRRRRLLDYYGPGRAAWEMVRKL